MRAYAGGHGLAAERMHLPLTGIEVVLAIVIMSGAAAVQATIGFGAGLIAAPLLVLIHPAFAPTPLLAASLVLTVLVAWRERASVDLDGLTYVITGRAIGTVPAAWLLATISGAAFDAVFGILVLVAVGLSLARGGFQRSGRNLTLAGIASGMMGTLSSIGGPPVALMYQRASPAVFRATLGVHLIVGTTMSLVSIWLVGRFGVVELALAGVLVPPVLLGYGLSRFGIHLVDAVLLRRAVLVLSSSAALAVVARALTR